VIAEAQWHVTESVDPYPERVPLHAEIPKVDVFPDGFDWSNLFIGLGGLAAAIVAIVIAVAAQASIARERRRQFELEILRDILIEVEEGDLMEDVEFNPGKLRRYRRRLSLIENPPSYWTTVMTADWYADLVPDVLERQREISAQHAVLVGRLGDDPTNDDLKAEVGRVREELSAMAREVREGVPRKLINQLETAIRQRWMPLTAGGPGPADHRAAILKSSPYSSEVQQPIAAHPTGQDRRLAPDLAPDLIRPNRRDSIGHGLESHPPHHASPGNDPGDPTVR
jgi:hypothetical protein